MYFQAKNGKGLCDDTQIAGFLHLKSDIECETIMK